MTTPVKLPTGRRPAKNAPALDFTPLLRPAAVAAGLPVVPATADYLAAVGGGWKMLGNDSYGDCVTPETLVLTGDLRWIPAGDLQPGDKLLAYDEEPRVARTEGGKRLGRQYRESFVTTADIIKRPCYELEFEDGTIVRSSTGHKWLVRSTEQGRLGTQTWVETKDLKCGSTRTSKVVKSFDTWQTETSFDAGYLAAAFDGEGHLDQKCRVREDTGRPDRSNRISFAQTDNQMLLEVERCLKELGFEPTHGHSDRTKYGPDRKDIYRLSIGQRSEMLRFLGSIRPHRLLPKLDISNLGNIKGDVVKLVRKEFIGDQDVVYLNTTSGTYFANGLASHNCEAVRWANARRLITKLLTAAEHYPDQADVLAIYRTQNPGFDPNGTAQTNGPGSSHDGGMDTQTLLEYLQKVGGPDGVKVVAFGKIAPSNVAAVEAAIAVFGAVWLDILVLDGNQTEFSRGVPWTNDGSAVDGGHAVLGGGYVPQRKIETWAAETELSDSFWQGTSTDGPLVEAVWVVVWPEHYGSKSFLQGVDQAQLAADFQALTGKTLPVPAPTPTPPAPVPPSPGAGVTRTFTPADAAALDAWAKARHTSGSNKAAAAAWKRGR